MYVFILLLIALVSVSGLPSRDIILEPISNNDLPEICIVMIQGADIKPEQYIPLMKTIQNVAKTDLKVWIGIPEFLGDMAFELNHGVDRVLDQMRRQGMTTQTIFMAGHSLGGAMVQTWTANHAQNVTGQVLMGSFLTHAWKKDYIFNYPVKTLTIGGELDGLARVTRISEAFYTQLLDPQTPSPLTSSNLPDFPVTVITGTTHMQFASGTPPDLVYKMDLVPERSYPEAHALIAHDFVAFLRATMFPTNSEGVDVLQRRLVETQAFVAPILEALHLEGYHNFRPPCLCETDICAPQPNCTARCPFTTLVSQPTMGAGLSGLRISDTDSFHDVWETEPTVHLPSIQNSCTDPDECQLDTTTVTQGAYHTGEDLEIWKKHFDVPTLDSGFLPITAFELKTKMNSRQSIYSHAGVKDPDFATLDGTGVRCGEINQKALDFATAKAGVNTFSRFEKYGQKYVIGADVDVCPAGTSTVHVYALFIVYNILVMTILLTHTDNLYTV